jgi:hypothetical protein
MGTIMTISEARNNLTKMPGRLKRTPQAVEITQRGRPRHGSGKEGKTFDRPAEELPKPAFRGSAISHHLPDRRREGDRLDLRRWNTQGGKPAGRLYSCPPSLAGWTAGVLKQPRVACVPATTRSFSPGAD